MLAVVWALGLGLNHALCRAVMTAHAHRGMLAHRHCSSHNRRLRHTLTEQEGCHQEAQEQSNAAASDTSHGYQYTQSSSVEHSGGS